MITLEELTTSPTEDQINTKLIAMLELMGLPASTWKSGGVARSVLKVVSTQFASFATLITFIATLGWLEKATGNWLTLLAKWVYGVDRISATFATGKITLVNGGGGVYGPYNPGEAIFVHNTSKKSYTNVALFTLNGGATLTIDVRAVEVGTASNAAPNEVQTQGTAMLGVSFTNTAAIAGSDEEADSVLRQRCLDSLGALSPNGPRSAYKYAVSIAKRIDLSPVDVNRSSVSPYSTNGTVVIYVASPAGPVTGSDLTQVAASVEKTARPDTASVSTLSAAVRAYTANVTVYAKAVDGLDATALATAVGAKLVEYVKNYPIGGIQKPGEGSSYLFGGGLEGAAKSANDNIFDTDGFTDLLLLPGEVATLATSLQIRLVQVQ